MIFVLFVWQLVRHCSLAKPIESLTESTFGFSYQQIGLATSWLTINQITNLTANCYRFVNLAS